MKIAILAGGTGRRLWPVSKKDLPKQFIDFFGTGLSLLQQACKHALKVVEKRDILIITRIEYRDIVMQQLPWLTPEQLLLEPVNRNTGPAAVWAAHRTAITSGWDSVVVFMPADQLVLNEDRFADALKIGEAYVSRNDTVLTLGVSPTRPEPGYGYIQVQLTVNSEQLTTGASQLTVNSEHFSVNSEQLTVNNVFSVNSDFAVNSDSAVKSKQPKTHNPKPKTQNPTPIYGIRSFVEKPDREFAEMFIQSGEFLWNTGIYMARAKFFLDQTKAFLPEIMRQYDDQSALENINDEEAFIYANYSRYPNLSLDTSILEKMPQRSVLHSDFGWADIGTWHGIYESVEKDAESNVVVNSESRVISDNSHHNIISLQDGKLAILSNLDGFIVAEKDNVLVICPKEDSSKQIRKFLNMVENS